MSADQLRLLQERAASVEEMSSSHAWQMLLGIAADEIEKHSSRIVQGRCKDQADYLRECGYIGGINFVCRLPAALQEELDRYLVEIQEAKEEEAYEQ